MYKYVHKYRPISQEKLNSCKGPSAYNIAVANGFEGTVQQWLNSLQGADAYIVAVANGFDGTEQEWLASLQGPQGPQGDDGIDGPQGFQGPSTGPQGSQGDDGPQGFQGSQGDEGPQGFQGFQGQIGPTGLNGMDGVLFYYRGTSDSDIIITEGTMTQLPLFTGGATSVQVSPGGLYYVTFSSSAALDAGGIFQYFIVTDSSSTPTTTQPGTARSAVSPAGEASFPLLGTEAVVEIQDMDYLAIYVFASVGNCDVAARSITVIYLDALP